MSKLTASALESPIPAAQLDIPMGKRSIVTIFKGVGSLAVETPRTRPLTQPLVQPEDPVRRGAGPTPSSEEGQTTRTAGSVPRTSPGDRTVREGLREFLRGLRVPPATEFELLLVVGEAVTNAVRYGEGKTITWSATATSARVVIELDYRTQQFNPVPPPVENLGLQEWGRGIILMRALTDSIDFSFRRGFVHLTLVKELRG